MVTGPQGCRTEEVIALSTKPYNIPQNVHFPSFFHCLDRHRHSHHDRASFALSSTFPEVFLFGWNAVEQRNFSRLISDIPVSKALVKAGKYVL